MAVALELWVHVLELGRGHIPCAFHDSTSSFDWTLDQAYRMFVITQTPKHRSTCPTANRVTSMTMKQWYRVFIQDRRY